MLHLLYYSHVSPVGGGTAVLQEVQLYLILYSCIKIQALYLVLLSMIELQGIPLPTADTENKAVLQEVKEIQLYYKYSEYTSECAP